jgi:hypothetical protein
MAVNDEPITPKISTITNEQIAKYLRIDDLTEDDADMLNIIKPAAKAYISTHTALSDEQLDEHADLTVAYLLIIQDMFDNRSMTVSSANVNQTAATILSMYALNHVG